MMAALGYFACISLGGMVGFVLSAMCAAGSDSDAWSQGFQAGYHARGRDMAS